MKIEFKYISTGNTLFVAQGRSRTECLANAKAVGLEPHTVGIMCFEISEPFDNQLVEDIVKAQDDNARMAVTPETVLGSFKEHKDTDFPWIKNSPSEPSPSALSTLPPESAAEIIGDDVYRESSHAIRHDQNKPHMDLLSPIAMFAMAKVLTKGLEKYPGSQWKKGLPWSKTISATMRHLFKFLAGEDLDFDHNCEGCKNNKCKDHSGLPHIDHVAVNVMFLQEYFRKHKDKDDRMKTGLE